MVRKKTYVVILVLLLHYVKVSAQIPRGWTAPFPGFRIIGNLYGVGTYDLSVFLITSDEGHILINTGLEGSLPQISKNVDSVGYKLEDVKILLTMQAHWDHVAGLAQIKSLTGAKMLATRKDARVLEDGGLSDAQFGGDDMRSLGSYRRTFQPVRVDEIVTEGSIIELGNIKLQVHEHPGHTEGSSSYSMQITENARSYHVVIANMGTINLGKRLIVKPTYPGIAEDFESTYRRQKAMQVDVWVAAHASQYNLHNKYKIGQTYDPDTFVDPEGFIETVERLEEKYLNQVQDEINSLQ